MNKSLEHLNIEPVRPKITARKAGLVLLLALLYTMFYTAILSNAEEVPLVAAFVSSTLSTSIKVVMLFGFWHIVLQRFYQRSGWIKLSLHIVLGVLFAVGWYYLYLLFFDLFFGLQYLESGGFTDEWVWIMMSAYFEYAIIFSVIHIMDSMKKLRLRERQAAELRELSNRQQIANLKAQLNPHFLFNTLNSINAMVSKDVNQTREMIAGLSDMLRYSIRSFEKEQVVLSEELDFVKQYLKLEKHRHGERLQYTIDVDKELLNVEIPPMIIQPIVENAVKHGIAPTEKGGSVKIVITEDGASMQVTVTDTGRGMPEPKEVESSDGIGIRNTNKYLQKRYGEQAKLRFEPIKPNGTKVWFKIPVGGDQV